MSRRECCTCLYGDLESSAAPCSGCFETSNWEYVREIHVSELQALRNQIKELQEQLCRENQCGACAKVKLVEEERDEARVECRTAQIASNTSYGKGILVGAKSMRERAANEAEQVAACSNPQVYGRAIRALSLEEPK